MLQTLMTFIGRLRFPSFSQISGLFLAPRTVTTALVPFNNVISELDGVSDHHADMAIDKRLSAASLTMQAQGHEVESQSAAAIASKIRALLT